MQWCFVIIVIFFHFYCWLQPLLLQLLSRSVDSLVFLFENFVIHLVLMNRKCLDASHFFCECLNSELSRRIYSYLERKRLIENLKFGFLNRFYYFWHDYHHFCNQFMESKVWTTTMSLKSWFLKMCAPCITHRTYLFIYLVCLVLFLHVRFIWKLSNNCSRLNSIWQCSRFADDKQKNERKKWIKIQ